MGPDRDINPPISRSDFKKPFRGFINEKCIKKESKKKGKKKKVYRQL